MARPNWTIDRLRRLGNARDRDADFELREVTLDDNEARDLVAFIDLLEHPEEHLVAVCGHARYDSHGHCGSISCFNYAGRGVG